MDIERLEAMVSQLTEANVRQKTEIDRLIGAMGRGIGGAPPAEAIRIKNMTALKLAFRKSSKVRDFKEDQELKVQEWLKQFDHEAETLKNMNGIVDALTREEYISCLKDKLEFGAIKRLDTAFATHQPAPLTWEAVTKLQIQDVMVAEFGKKESDVSAVLMQFGPGRFKKTPEMSVATYYHKWQEQLPDCMAPETDDDRKKFVQLILRSLFYFGLEDKHLQEELCKIKPEEESLKKFLDEAILAEQRRRSFMEIGVSGAQLDSASGVAVNAWSGSGGTQAGNKSFGGGPRIHGGYGGKSDGGHLIHGAYGGKSDGGPLSHGGYGGKSDGDQKQQWSGGSVNGGRNVQRSNGAKQKKSPPGPC